MPTILVIGGYGAVGSKIARQLAERDDATVIIAGRSLDKAQSMAGKLQVSARRIDLASPQSWDNALEGVGLAVTAIDQTDTGFLEYLGARGIAYVDVTAGDAFFQKAEAVHLPQPAVLSVGLAPGLSNLLAVAASADMEEVTAIDIGVLMGTGDEHGSAAIAWSTAQMFDTTASHDDKVIDFGPHFGPRKAYFMGFADQYVLNRRMGGVKVTTRVTYDSAALTAGLFWAGRHFAGNATVEALVRSISHLPTPGSDKCVLSVTATGRIGGRPVSRDAFFFGKREAAVTAAMAVAVTEQILDGKATAGVRHAHEIFDPATLFARIEGWGHGRFDIRPLTSPIAQ